MLDSEAIARSLENVHTDGSSWLVKNQSRDYFDFKKELIHALKYETYWNHISKDKEWISALREWRDNTPDWEHILESNDVAMYPECLHNFKKTFLCLIEKEHCEDITRLSYMSRFNMDGNSSAYHNALLRCKSDYGVFRLRCNIGDNLYKQLRRHLNITDEDFEDVYGLALYEEPDCCDDLLIEMLTEGHLSGAIRSYKIENEYYFS